MVSHQRYISFVIYNKLIRLFYIALCKFKYVQIIINKLMTLNMWITGSFASIKRVFTSSKS